MKLAVWDTYVRKEDGCVLHFDILVPETVTDKASIFEYGEAYLNKKGVKTEKVDTAACQFCHVESPTADQLLAVKAMGYAIIEMENIPLNLPTSPSRRDLIFHLKAHYPEQRFSDLRGKSIQNLQQLIASS
jgi:hypothetical protein